MAVELAEFKRSQRQSWEEGDYRPVGRLLEPAARLLVDKAGVTVGQRVLDVATGSGSVAIAAAEAGAEVCGVDHTDAWFDEARRRSSDAGVEIALELGDAEDLPYEAESFDAVLSSFGAIFAPRHDVVATELSRVCRSGGTIGLTAWTTGGPNDRIFSALLERLPDPPSFAKPAMRWGDPDYVRELFSPWAVEFTFTFSRLPVEFPSGEAFESFIFDNSGPYIAARRALEEMGHLDESVAAMREEMEAANEADDSGFRMTWEFLVAVGVKPA